MAEGFRISNAHYLQSSNDLADLPKAILPEYAFAGRSNVGKSSLINMLCGRRKLAITSATPGRTKLINHFLVDDGWYLVDLPGFGFAKSSRALRKSWLGIVEAYIRRRKNLVSVIFLVDISIPPMNSDFEFLSFLGKNEIPLVVALTKSDRLGKTQLDKNMSKFKEGMLRDWDELPQLIVTSAKNKAGREELLSYIGESNAVYRKYIRSAQ